MNDKTTNASNDVSRNELKQVERLLKLDPKNTELLAQKQKLLGEAIGGATSKLESLKKPDIKDLYFDDVRKAICWKAVGESVAWVNIYQYNADNTISFVCKTSGDEYFYEKVGTYLVCPVLEDGTDPQSKENQFKILSKEKQDKVSSGELVWSEQCKEFIPKQNERDMLFKELIKNYEDEICIRSY